MYNSCLFVVEGGLGKSIIALSLLKPLKKKYQKVYVLVAYPDIFQYAGLVDGVFLFGSHIYNELILQDDVEVLWREPYNNNDFIKKRAHILEAWTNELDLKKEEIDYDFTFDNLPNDLLKETEKIKNDINGDYLIIQFTGGQSPINPQDKYIEVLKRNYPYPQELIDKLSEIYSSTTILNFSLPNENNYQKTIRLEAPYLYYVDLLKEAKAVICIDSSLQHISKVANKQAIVLWGETRPKHFGWKKHINLAKPVFNSAPYFKPLGQSPAIVEFAKPDEVINKLDLT
ncbi:MAG: glycosyltransferase family 9 protein [Candidatus Heimdallarchaeaceae archaeon]